MVKARRVGNVVSASQWVASTAGIAIGVFGILLLVLSVVDQSSYHLIVKNDSDAPIEGVTAVYQSEDGVTSRRYSLGTILPAHQASHHGGGLEPGLRLEYRFKGVQRASDHGYTITGQRAYASIKADGSCAWLQDE